ncbi:RNA polymerase sigma factor [Simiduia aestuariiviva]|uniref:RNA polymerase sigma-70 factor (ECF subfamily) n=1 Tax=Simiduia aestuariiviva TaxID=1510459 RepID=A0A839UNB4_9GAMM|nr:sigma-70 family RNA polymerase sigma factor [Simiduia aestuariiviva]MBB3169332.1 RNA polymerase sigma-70 factor (ECF subfamily) [Simiduia aestuariiviva]
MTTQEHAEALWHTYSAGIVRTLSGYEADPQLREDLAQEIFCAIAQSATRIMAAQNSRAYVYRIAHNVAVDHIARQVKDQAELHEPEQLAQLQDTASHAIDHCPAEQLQRDQRQQKLLAAIRELDAPYRQVIVLLLEDLNSTEIADVLQISAGAVRVRINRAKAALKERLLRSAP